MLGLRGEIICFIFFSFRGTFIVYLNLTDGIFVEFFGLLLNDTHVTLISYIKSVKI